MRKALYIGRVLLGALILIFSFQIFRVFVSVVIWNLGLFLPGPYSLALFALAVFASALLTPAIQKVTGDRGIIAVSVFGIVLMRMAMQIVDGPVYLIVLSTSGVVMFLWFFTAWMRSGLNYDKEYPPVMAVAFPVGVLMDVCSRVLLMSYDIVWRNGTWTLFTVAGISLAILILVWTTVVRGRKEGEEAEPGFLRAFLIAGIGPWLYLGMALYQNAGAAAGHTGISDMQICVILCIANAVGAFMSTFIAVRPRKRRFAIAFPLSLILILSTWGILEAKGFVIYLFCAGSVSMWMLPGLLFSGRSEERRGAWGTPAGVFAGFILMLVLIFLHANFGISGMIIAASIIISIAAVLASLSDIDMIDWSKAKACLSIAGISCIIAVGAVDLMALEFRLPMTYWIFPGSNIRVLTYNIHQGYDADYRMDLEGITDEIKRLNPDIICLQEVNRAQLSNGMVDCLMLISHELGMPYVFGANSNDRQYGNAVLTRYPVRDWDNLEFFSNSTETRGVLHAVVRIRQNGDARSDLNVFVTHLDHIAGPGNVREKQAREVVEFWAKRPRSVVAGDFNAEPDAEEMKPFYTSGLRDALEQSGNKHEKTFWDGYGEPAMKLDYIFISDDLNAAGALIDDSRASDHKPVAVDIKR